MNGLIKSTTAYKIFSADRQSGRLSHAYMLHFSDVKNLKGALKIFACEFFGAKEGTNLFNRISGGSYPDFKLYPQDDKKLTADAVSEIIEDSSMRPVEGDKKLFVISGFDQASALLQNKLLKTLEEPLEGVYFLLGAASLAPVLDTVKSRVKTLEIPPFSERQIYEALERQGHSDINAEAAKSANGILGAAENMVGGGWFEKVEAAAREICGVTSVSQIGEVAAKYGDIKEKQELLDRMQSTYFEALTKGTGAAKGLSKSTLIFALEKLSEANADLKFNAYFNGLLYDFLLAVATHERRVKN